ncbi:MAG: hypothetical protein J1E97_04455 [Muribaculaceae bacterium]|nr:hypothetical protein [Muribaculaceae bacterium]
MKKFKALLSAILVGAVAFSASAQEKLIEGYFRVQNAGNGQFIEVTGPFDASASLDEETAKGRAGAVIYLSAVQDGDSYLLTSLSSQGIDVVKDEVPADSYFDVIIEALNYGGDPVQALIRQGFNKGYTSIARATVGFVFMFVATALEGYTQDESGMVRWSYENVAKDFNREVTAVLDLGIRMKPVPGKENTMQLYFDVPSLQPAVDWYTAEDTEEHKVRKATFESAMDAMSFYLSANGKGINLETFLPADVAMLKDWGYDIVAQFPEAVVTDDAGNQSVELSFRQIFADADLLFNWVKMVAYYMLNPDNDPHGLSSLGYGFVADAMQENYLASLLMQYMHRVQPGQRIYLINGRVYNDEGNVSTVGTHWDAADNTLGFAEDVEMGIAAENGQWVLYPIDNETNIFQPALSLVVSGNSYSGICDAFYFDFPVSAEGTGVKFQTVSNIQSTNINSRALSSSSVSYVELEDLGDNVPAGTPFIITADDVNVKLKIRDGSYTLKPLAADAAAAKLSAEEAYQLRKVRKLANESTDGLKGVYFETSTGLSDFGENIYPFSIGVVGNSSHMVFSNSGEETLPANSVLYTSSEPLSNDMLVVGQPQSDIPTAVETIDSEEAQDGVFFNLQGVPVSNPQPGQVYIHAGKKVLVVR